MTRRQWKEEGQCADARVIMILNNKIPVPDATVSTISSAVSAQRFTTQNRVHRFGIECDRSLLIGVSNVARRSLVDAVELDDDNDRR